MSDKHYVIYSKIIAVLGSALLYWLTGSLWSLLCLLLSAYIDGELKED
jgi:hypothetical protein